MRYETLKEMVSIVRKEVRKFCGGQMPTLDEAESLAYLLGIKLGDLYCKAGWDRMGFEQFIRNGVRQEILRTCT